MQKAIRPEEADKEPSGKLLRLEDEKYQPISNSEGGNSSSNNSNSEGDDDSPSAPEKSSSEGNSNSDGDSGQEGDQQEGPSQLNSSNNSNSNKRSVAFAGLDHSISTSSEHALETAHSVGNNSAVNLKMENPHETTTTSTSRKFKKQRTEDSSSSTVSNAKEQKDEDGEDSALADRRAANRLSAFQSRQRRKRIIEDLQKTVGDLTQHNSKQTLEIQHLRGILSQLRSENQDLRQQQQQLIRQQHQGNSNVVPIANIFGPIAAPSPRKRDSSTATNMMPASTSQKNGNLPDQNKILEELLSANSKPPSFPQGTAQPHQQQGPSNSLPAAPSSGNSSLMTTHTTNTIPTNNQSFSSKSVPPSDNGNKADVSGISYQVLERLLAAKQNLDSTPVPASNHSHDVGGSSNFQAMNNTGVNNFILPLMSNSTTQGASSSSSPSNPLLALLLAQQQQQAGGGKQDSYPTPPSNTSFQPTQGNPQQQQRPQGSGGSSAASGGWNPKVLRMILDLQQQKPVPPMQQQQQNAPQQQQVPSQQLQFNPHNMTNSQMAFGNSVPAPAPPLNIEALRNLIAQQQQQQQQQGSNNGGN